MQQTWQQLRVKRISKNQLKYKQVQKLGFISNYPWRHVSFCRKGKLEASKSDSAVQVCAMSLSCSGVKNHRKMPV